MQSPPLRPAPRRADLILHELDGEALLYDPMKGDTHRVNETAFFIWHECDGVRSTMTIAKSLTERYDVDLSTAEFHVATILAKFDRFGLLSPPGPTAECNPTETISPASER